MQQVLKSNDPCWCGSGRKFKRCHKVSSERIRPGRVSPMRTVPPEIGRPHYAETGDVVRRPESGVQSADVIERMRKAGRIAAEILAIVGDAVRPGITTEELDAIAHEEHVRRGIYPSPLNYHGYPKAICTSVNEVICHGIPDDRALVEGDIVNIDVTSYVDGVHGDTNATFAVGRIDDESRKLIDVTRECLERGIAAVAPGKPFNVIGKAIQEHAEAHGYGVVRTFVGHGIGEQFHTDLHVPHYFDPALTRTIETGMTFTIEPMITIGDWRHRMWNDGWTAVTADGKRTAQFEHTILVTDDGPEILTRLDG
ncbi:MAG TPA: type I methionyl aminopeptidase [Acidimicrobiales bacterium]|jgi:methionyl aminopeptidase|nr:type I methionyl aminopeptidase [Acidimicrobiales bacterium]